MNVRLYGVTAKKYNEIVNAFNEHNITFGSEWDSEPGLYNIAFVTDSEIVKVFIYGKFISIGIVGTVGLAECVDVYNNDFEIIKIV